MSPVHRRIVCFFLVTYLLSWFGHVGNWIFPSNYWPLPMNPFGPLIAAPLVIWATEGWAEVSAWLRRLARFKAPLRVYAIALVIPIAIILASLWLASKAGVAIQSLPPRGAVEFLILIPIMLIAGPAPEEVSFRGYGQSLLQTVTSPLTAAIWIGAGVAVWHIPLFLLGNVPYPFIVTLVAVSIVYAWLYQLGGSIWPVVALHFSVNYFGGEYFGTMIAEPAGQRVYAWFFAAFYVLWAAFILWRYGPELGRRSDM
jgi:uncharacterized protein